VKSGNVVRIENTGKKTGRGQEKCRGNGREIGQETGLVQNVGTGQVIVIKIIGTGHGIEMIATGHGIKIVVATDHAQIIKTATDPANEISQDAETGQKIIFVKI